MYDLTDIPRQIVVLEGAERYIKKGWTQFEFARDESLKPVSPDSRKACMWCLNAAVFRSAQESAAGTKWKGSELHMIVVSNLNLHIDPKIKEARSGSPIINWNDRPSRKGSQVLDLLSDMIVTLQNAQQPGKLCKKG